MLGYIITVFLSANMHCIAELRYAYRPGTMDTSVEQPVMVTFDLSSVGYYNQLALFNVLNGSMNRGWVGIYRVTPDGFSIKQIESGELLQLSRKGER